MAVQDAWQGLWRLWHGSFGTPDVAWPAAAADPGYALPAEASDERLRRLATWCRDGRLAAAELELHEWQRSADCPPAARTLLASLQGRRGATDDALGVLERGAATQADSDGAVDLGQLHFAILTAAGLAKRADTELLRLHQEHGDDAAVAAWVQAMQGAQSAKPSAQPDLPADQLAAELRADPQVIPSLVAAQKIQSTKQDLSLLRRAIEKLTHDVHEDDPQMLMVCQALAELALLGDDAADARRWAHRGLRINPFAATLAVILSQVPDNAAAGPTADLVLQGAIDAHPAYPDLRAAMVRYELAHGRDDKALLFLAHWLNEQPDQPLARRLQKELAA